jgi:hypothetical protein
LEALLHLSLLIFTFLLEDNITLGGKLNLEVIAKLEHHPCLEYNPHLEEKPHLEVLPHLMERTFQDH